MTDSDILTPHEAARYFGCSPTHLRKLRTLGWLRAVEDRSSKGTRCKFVNTHYLRVSLDWLADMYWRSLCIYDWVAVIYDQRPIKVVAAYRGIPLLVIEHIRRSPEIAALLEHPEVKPAVERALKRKGDIQSLAKDIRRHGYDLGAHPNGRRAEAMTANTKRKWRDAGNKAMFIMNVSYDEVYGPNGILTEQAKNLSSTDKG